MKKNYSQGKKDFGEGKKEVLWWVSRLRLRHVEEYPPAKKNSCSQQGLEPKIKPPAPGRSKLRKSHPLPPSLLLWSVNKFVSASIFPSGIFSLATPRNICFINLAVRYIDLWCTRKIWRTLEARVVCLRVSPTGSLQQVLSKQTSCAMHVQILFLSIVRKRIRLPIMVKRNLKR